MHDSFFPQRQQIIVRRTTQLIWILIRWFCALSYICRIELLTSPVLLDLRVGDDLGLIIEICLQSQEDTMVPPPR